MRSKILHLSCLILSIFIFINAKGEDEVEIKDFQCGFNMIFDIDASPCCVKLSNTVANVITTITSPGTAQITNLVEKGLSFFKSDGHTPIKTLEFSFESTGKSDKDHNICVTGDARITIYHNLGAQLRIKNPKISLIKNNKRKKTETKELVLNTSLKAYAGDAVKKIMTASKRKVYEIKITETDDSTITSEDLNSECGESRLIESLSHSDENKIKEKDIMKLDKDKSKIIYHSKSQHKNNKNKMKEKDDLNLESDQSNVVNSFYVISANKIENPDEKEVAYDQKKSTFGCSGKCAVRAGTAKISIDKWALLTNGLDFGDLKLKRNIGQFRSKIYNPSKINKLKDVDVNLKEKKKTH